MSCNKCETKKCSCGKGSTPVMPPSECNTPTCPDPAPCSEITPTACIQYVGEAKLCGEDEVFAEGDTIGVIEGKIVDYFCERLSNVSEEVIAASTIVTQADCGEDTVYETGDTIIEALEKTVDYFCTELSDINGVISGLAAVASSGAYSDLSGLPTALSDFSNDLLTADELAAINGANTPSALNTFATINDVPTAVSELSNDSGFLTTNFYNADDTLTGNRTVTGGGFSLKFTGQSSFNIVAPNSNQASKGLTIRNAGDSDDLFNVRGNGEFQAKRVGDYVFEYFDYGNGFPALSMYAPTGGQIQQRFIFNGGNKASFSVSDNGNTFGITTQATTSLVGRHNVDFVSNNIQFIKNVNGEWLFTNDPTGTQNPETGVRAKFYGTVKTVSPSASALDTAFSVRNSLDNSDSFLVDGANNIRIGGIGNTGARLGVKGVNNSASTYNTLLTNLAGDFLFQLDNDGGLRTNLGNYRQFKFGNDNYFETVGGSAYYRGNGFGYFNVNLSGGINFESTNFGGGQAHASAKVQIESTTQGFRIVPMTATQASAITPVEGLELNVSDTNGTFTSIGKWQYIGGAWVKL